MWPWYTLIGLMGLTYLQGNPMACFTVVLGPFTLIMHIIVALAMAYENY